MRVFLVTDDGRGLEQRRAGADAGDTLTDNDSLGSRMTRDGHHRRIAWIHNDYFSTFEEDIFWGGGKTRVAKE